jgi:hypothetical protein
MIATQQLSAQYGNEAAAVVVACRIFVGSATVAEFQDLVSSNGFDWRTFYRLAGMHHVRPIVFKAIHTADIPDETRQKLQQISKRFALRNLDHARELVRLSKLFAAQPITAVPYKGSVLGLKYYKDLTLRESSDLDFLIDTGEKHILALRNVMKGTGYVDKSDIPERFLKTYLKYSREYSFDMMEGDERKFHAEFHWYAASQVFDFDKPMPNAVLFENTGSMNLLNEQVSTLSDEANLLSIVLHHGLNQKWGQMKYVMDMCMLLQHSGGLDMDRVRSIAQKYGFVKPLELGLFLSAEIMGVAVEGALHQPADARYYQDALFVEKAGDKTLGSMLSEGLKIRDGFAAKSRLIVKYLIYALAPSILDYRFVRLPRVLYPIYAIIKPIRLLLSRR